MNARAGEPKGGLRSFSSLISVPRSRTIPRPSVRERTTSVGKDSYSGATRGAPPPDDTSTSRLDPLCALREPALPAPDPEQDSALARPLVGLKAAQDG